jgi:putative membrane protein
MFVIALFYPILYYYAHLRFVNRGYIISGDKLAVKQGVWFKSLTVIPIRKIQTFRIHQTIFQRRLGLATINVDTAAAGITGDISIIDIDLRDAARLNQDIKSKFFETL